MSCQPCKPNLALFQMGVKVVRSLRSGHQNTFSRQGLKNLDELASDLSKTAQNHKKRMEPLSVRDLGTVINGMGDLHFAVLAFSGH